MKKHNFRSGIKIFALGAFTGYPVLPGVSAPLSDGDREYREKQMIIQPPRLKSADGLQV